MNKQNDNFENKKIYYNYDKKKHIINKCLKLR